MSTCCRRIVDAEFFVGKYTPETYMKIKQVPGTCLWSTLAEHRHHPFSLIGFICRKDNYNIHVQSWPSLGFPHDVVFHRFKHIFMSTYFSHIQNLLIIHNITICVITIINTCLFSDQSSLHKKVTSHVTSNYKTQKPSYRTLSDKRRLTNIIWINFSHSLWIHCSFIIQSPTLSNASVFMWQSSFQVQFLQFIIAS